MIAVYIEGHFLKRPRLKLFKNYIFATRKVWCFIRYTQFLGAIFFGTFWISTNREGFMARHAITPTEKFNFWEI